MRSAIIVVVEGLNSGLVGAYGSNTAVTPAIDGLASRSLILDQCFADSLDRESQLRSLWTSRHAAQIQLRDWSLWHHWQKNGQPARLLTDCPRVAEIAEELGCDQVELFEVAPSTEPASDWTECTVAQLFAAAATTIAQATSEVVWIHSRGLRHVWDAPLDLREKFIDPEDPLPPSEACVPSIAIDEGTNPDEVVGWGQVAAAQVAVIDQALDILIQEVASRPDAHEFSWMFVSPCGVPLGEHGQIGWGRSQLHGEELSSVAMIRRAGDPPIGNRRAELCQLPDLAATLVDLLCDDPIPSHVWGRSLLELTETSQPQNWPAVFQQAFVTDPALGTWLRTPAWSWLYELNQIDKLFVKPDDRWEVSDIASRRVDVTERLRELAKLFSIALEQNTRSELPVLEQELCNLLR